MIKLLMDLIKKFYSFLDAKYEAEELMGVLAEKTKNRDGDYDTYYYDPDKIEVHIFSLKEAIIYYYKSNGYSLNRETEKVYHKGLKRFLPFTFLIDVKVIKLKHKLLKKNAKTKELVELKKHYSKEIN